MTHIWDHELAKHMIERLIKGMTFAPCCTNRYPYDDSDKHCCDNETTDLVESMCLDDDEASAQWNKEYFIRAARPHRAHYWEPRMAVGNADAYDAGTEDGGYWIYWYTRMTSDWSFAETAARYFAERDDGHMATMWRETARDIRRMGIDFGTALYALGSIVRATEPKETP